LTDTPACAHVEFVRPPRSSQGGTARLETVLAACKDVDTIMGTMPQAIRKAALKSS
jgi:hypothetical protein